MSQENQNSLFKNQKKLIFGKTSTNSEQEINNWRQRFSKA